MLLKKKKAILKGQCPQTVKKKYKMAVVKLVEKCVINEYDQFILCKLKYDDRMAGFIVICGTIPCPKDWGHFRL